MNRFRFWLLVLAFFALWAFLTAYESVAHGDDELVRLTKALEAQNAAPEKPVDPFAGGNRADSRCGCGNPGVCSARGCGGTQACDDESCPHAAKAATKRAEDGGADWTWTNADGGYYWRYAAPPVTYYAPPPAFYRAAPRFFGGGGRFFGGGNCSGGSCR